MLTWNTGLRPKRSASMPELSAPMAMPTKLALPSMPACALVRPNSVRIEPSRYVIMARSRLSKKKASAITMNRKR
ncbi:hypothetical protein D3C72_2014510 [compost metagenome]